MRIIGLALLLCLAACAPEGASNAPSQDASDAQAARTAESKESVPGEPADPSKTVHGEPVEPQPQPVGAEPVDPSGTVHDEPVEPQPQPADANPVDPSETIPGQPVEPRLDPPSDESTKGPEPARRVPEELLTKDEVYYGCKTPADCEVKNVGNCCGYYPACVNKESPTFPDKVKAACAAEGSSSICGFPEIAGCDCVEGRCTAQRGPGGGDLR